MTMLIDTTPAASGNRPTRAIRRVGTVLRLATEIPAALLLLAEIVVLSVGVIARYVFHRPITWSDELATSLFLWLVMFGAVIALQRSAHMRLSTLVDRVGPVWRCRLEALGSALMGAILVAIVISSRDHVEDQWNVITPALRIRDGMRVMAIPIGATLMVVVLITQSLMRGTLKQTAAACALVGAASVALWLGHSALTSLGNVLSLIH